MSSPAMKISSILNSDGTLNLSEGTNLFVGREPITPDDCTTIYDTGGGEQSDRLALDDATFQIRMRSKSYETAYTKLNAIKLVLQSLSAVVVDQDLLVGVWANSNIAFIETDEQDRSVFVWNGRMVIEPSDKGNRN